MEQRYPNGVWCGMLIAIVQLVHDDLDPVPSDCLAAQNSGERKQNERGINITAQ